MLTGSIGRTSVVNEWRELKDMGSDGYIWGQRPRDGMWFHASRSNAGEDYRELFDSFGDALCQCNIGVECEFHQSGEWRSKYVPAVVR